MSLHHICAQSKQERWFLIQMVEQVLVDPHPVLGPRPCEPLNVSGLPVLYKLQLTNDDLYESIGSERSGLGSEVAVRT